MTAVDNTTSKTPQQMEGGELPKRGNCWTDEVCRDWGQYILALSGTTSTAGAAWGFATLNYPQGALFVAALVGSAFGFFRIRSLKPKRDFETNIAAFQAEETRLKAENEKLVHTIATMDALKDNINTNYQRQAQKLKKTLKSNRDLVAQINKLNTALKESQTNAADLEKLYQNLKKTFEKAAVVLSNLNEAKGELNNSEDEISDDVKKIGETVTNIDGENKEFDEENKELSNTIDKFHTELNGVEERLHQVLKEKEELKAIVDRLDESDDKLLQGADKISSIEEVLKAQNEALAKKVTELEALFETVTKQQDQ